MQKTVGTHRWAALSKPRICSKDDSLFPKVYRTVVGLFQSGTAIEDLTARSIVLHSCCKHALPSHIPQHWSHPISEHTGHEGGRVGGRKIIRPVRPAANGTCGSCLVSWHPLYFSAYLWPRSTQQLHSFHNMGPRLTRGDNQICHHQPWICCIISSINILALYYNNPIR